MDVNAISVTWHIGAFSGLPHDARSLRASIGHARRAPIVTWAFLILLEQRVVDGCRKMYYCYEVLEYEELHLLVL